MNNLTLAFALLPFAALVGQASPVTDYDIVGQFTLQQTGNEITGNYSLTETDTTNSYLVLDSSGQNLIGTFKLTETDSSGSFELQQESNETAYLVESGNDLLGTYSLQQQGNAITGNYQLGVQAPEPSSWIPAAAGVGCLLLRRRDRSRGI